MRHRLTWGSAYAAAGLLLVWCAGCARAREFELRGQVLAVDPGRREVTVKHEDIRGFMPGMTMPFKVRDASLLEGRTAGDLIRATLVVEDSDAYLKTIERTGHAPLAETPPAHPRVDPLNPGEVVPDVSFVDQDGRSRRLSEWRGRTVGVTFIYTRCPIPDFCPLMDRRFAEVQRHVVHVVDARLRGGVQLLSVSVDPAFDTPAVLAAHAKKVSANPATWSFVTGDRSEIDSFASRFGVSSVREAASAPEVMHNLRTAVIDGNGRLVKVFTGNQWQASDLLAELRSAGGAR